MPRDPWAEHDRRRERMLQHRERGQAWQNRAPAKVPRIGKHIHAGSHKA